MRTKDKELKVGDRVSFRGFNARPYETVGEVIRVGTQYCAILWDARPEMGAQPIHISQVKVIDK